MAKKNTLLSSIRKISSYTLFISYKIVARFDVSLLLMVLLLELNIIINVTTMNSLESRKKSKLKPIVVLLFFAIFLVSGIVVYAYMQKLGPFAEDQQKNATSSRQNDLNSVDANGSPDDIPVADNSKTPESSEDVESDKNSSVLEITSTQKLDDVVRIRTLIQKVTQQGECVLEATNNGKTYNATVGVQPTASSSTCKGFDIPVSSLPPGTWDIQISYIANGEKSVARTKASI